MEKIKKQFYDQGYVEGKKAGEAESKKEYEVSKKDYWDTLNKNLKDAKKEIDEIKQFVDSIDKEIPDLILNFVENIVGEERKLNDQLVVSVIRNSLGKLKRLQDVIFYVNPEDAETVREHFQDFDIKSDDDVTKGSFKVKSKIGEIDFSIESALNDLQKEINEQFRSD
jgi:flagellar assembly protein FliH